MFFGLAPSKEANAFVNVQFSRMRSYRFPV